MLEKIWTYYGDVLRTETWHVCWRPPRKWKFDIWFNVWYLKMMMELIERIEHDDLYRFVRNWRFETVERWIFTNGKTDPTGPIPFEFLHGVPIIPLALNHPKRRWLDPKGLWKRRSKSWCLWNLERMIQWLMVHSRKLVEYLPAKMGSWSPIHRLNRFTATESWSLNPWLDPEVYWGVQFQLSLKQVWECWCFVELRTSIWRQLSES